MMRLSDIVQRGLFLWDMETKNAKLHVHVSSIALNFK